MAESNQLHEGGGGAFERPASSQRSLAKVGFFHDIDPATVAQMERRCRWLDLDKGDVLAEAGEQPEKIFFLLYGELLFSLHTRAAKTLLLPAIAPGSFFDLTSLIPGKSPPYSIEAARPSTVASMGVRTFYDFLQRDSAVMHALLKTLVERQQILLEHIEELTTLSVRERIHHELVRLCRNSTYADGSAVIFPVPTHEDIAHRIGTHREAVSREMSHLQQIGAIVRQDNALFVADVARLDAPGHRED